MTARRRTVLVTGARGFLGAYCLPLLAERGFEVIAVSSADRHPEQRGVRWRRCDLLNPVACGALLREELATHLLHLAWITKPGVFWSSHQNLEWLSAGVRLVDMFYVSGGERAVGIGSCAEYVTSDEACVEGVTPIEPATVYGKAKAAMHLALQAAAQNRGSYAWGRIFVPYGPGEAADRFIPNVIAGLLRGEPVACTHGTQQRDFVFAADAAAACVALLESERSGAYNIAAGSAVSLRRITELIVGQLGRGELVRFGARSAPAFDAPRIIADVAKIRTEIGWIAQIGLEEGLARSIEAQKRSQAER